MGRSVLVVGGLDRLASRYEETVCASKCRFITIVGTVMGGRENCTD
ncbi:MAG: hypothetical protein KIIPBIDF_00476 [Candidatus Methanoperedenaceae archaeon GB50]|nr:MAG: hypothetical protein KIIPBIDF_00476 [Candidatus Methanoperedenaceae archaeon GB50]